MVVAAVRCPSDATDCERRGVTRASAREQSRKEVGGITTFSSYRVTFSSMDSCSLATRRRVVRAVGLCSAVAIAGCSSGSGGCSVPDTDAAPTDLLPEGGGEFGSAETMEPQGFDSRSGVDSAIRGVYTAGSAQFAVTVARFVSEERASDYLENVLRPNVPQYGTDGIFVILQTGNFHFYTLAEGSATDERKLTDSEKLTGESPVLNEQCVKNGNVLRSE